MANAIDNLVYELRGFSINPRRIKYIEYESGHDTYDQGHKFILALNGNSVEIYISEATSHKRVVEFFGISNIPIVGGGSYYVDNERFLAINDYSEDFGSVPKFVAHNIGEMTLDRLLSIGIEVRGIKAEPWEWERVMNDFWKKQGYGTR